MRDERLPSLAFRITPGSSRPHVNLAIHIPDQGTVSVDGASNLLPLAAVLAWFKVEAMRHPEATLIDVDETPYGAHTELFDKAHNFIGNAIRSDSLVLAGERLDLLRHWLKARQDKRRSPKFYVQINASRLIPGNVWFGVITRSGASSDCYTEGNHVALFNYLIGATDAAGLTFVEERRESVPVFRFGTQSTGTYVIHQFPGGLHPHYVRCRLTGQVYSAPADIEQLIARAHDTFIRDAPGIVAVKDQAMLAPRRVAAEMVDLDSGDVTLDFDLSDSSYRYYAAFAFARRLARRDEAFAPLLHYVESTPDPYQPAPATCSMGVRVLVETSDAKLLVAYRSHQVKLNPNVWSVSANEGIRRNLLDGDGNVADLLRIAVKRALLNELRVEAKDCDEPLLLSIYRNTYNQWGAGFCICTSLTADQIIARQAAASHRFEHGRLATLPTDVTSCGRAMRDLGTRWYGGALETICQFLAWRELAEDRVASIEEIGRRLSHASGHTIEPVDETNPALLPPR